MRIVTLILSSAMVVIGLAIIVRTFAEGGAIAFGIVVGLLFMVTAFRAFAQEANAPRRALGRVRWQGREHE